MKPFEQGLPPADWDEQQRVLSGHLLQGRPWAQFQLALGRRVAWASADGWSWLGEVRRGRGVKYLYAANGPTVRSAKALEEALASLKQAAAELGLDFVRCEPMGVPEAAVMRMGLSQVKPMQPQHTLLVDLTKSEEELRSDLSSSHRNTINGAERRGLSFRASTDSADTSVFLQLLARTASSRGFREHPDSYYRTMLDTLMPLGAAKLFIAEHEDKPVAASLALDYQGTRAYAHTGTAPEARSLRVTAPLVWQMMLEAKQSGLTQFDLWGIAPEGAPSSHPWAGFTEFKRSFGGQEVAYVGTWELPVKTWKYPLYRLAKKLV